MKKLVCRVLLISSAAVVAVACTTVNNISVNNASNSGELRQSSFLYALPQTVLDVNVVATESIIVPGPYERYADKYLSIQHPPAKTEKIYTLKSISISRHIEADPDFIYMANGISDPEAFPNVSSLLRDSLILTAADFSENRTISYNWASAHNDLLFTDFSVKRNFEAEKDIEISTVLPDTNYVARPSTSRTVLKEKTIEQKAEEAANFLIKLKKRRFKLVAGQYDYMPEGESMESALQELARLEQEYLALFIGRRINNELKRSFHYTPEPEKDSRQIVLFRFSPSRGVLNANETEGIPVVIEIQPLNKLRELGRISLPSKQPVNTLPYRVADQVNIKVLAGEQIWAEATYPVYQFGVPVSLNLIK